MRILGIACTLTWIMLALCPAASHAQTCSYFLNATNGDDRNSGEETAPVQSFEYAFRTFPSDAVVCMTAGEYFHSMDADGVQLTGAELAGKNMQFVLQSFADETEIAFTEDELRIDIGSGRVDFFAGSTSALRLGSGSFNTPERFPANTTFLHTVVLGSGVLDLSRVDVAIGASVGNPHFQRDGNAAIAAPDSATIARGTGTLIGTAAYVEAPRSLTYIGSGDRSAENEVPPLIGRLVFDHVSGTVTVSKPLSFAESATIELAGAGAAKLESPVSISSAGSSTVLVTGSGAVDMSGRFSASIAGDAARLAHVNSSGRLVLRHLDVANVGGGLNPAASVVNSGSGLLEVHVVETASDVHVALVNEGNGSCRLGTSASSTSIDADLVNRSSGHCVIESGTAVDGTILNEGQTSILGPIDLAAPIENAGTINLQADVTFSGPLLNTGDIELSVYTLTMSGAGPHENDGRILSTDETGSLSLGSSLSIVGDGELPDLLSSSGTHVVSASSVRGGVTVHAEGDLTLETGEMRGALHVDGGSARIEAAQAAALKIESGELVLQSDLSTGEVVQHTGSSVDLGSHTLALTGSFRRNGGTFASAGGGLVFRGTSLQQFQPGPDLLVDKIGIVGTSVQLTSGPVQVRDSLTVSDGSKLLLFDYDLRLVGDRAVVSNDGEISTSITGSLVFSGPRGSTQIVTGTGLFSNVEVAMEDEDDVVVVQNATLRQGGILTLESGQLRLSAGSTYSLVSTRGVPFIRRNLGDVNGDGEPAGKAIDANTAGTGLFLSPDTGFNLEYFGTLDGTAAIGAEFVSGQIVDLLVRISGPSGTQATLSLSGDVSFTGALELGAAAILETGAFDLLATGSGVTHDVEGRIESSNGAFAVSGGSVTIRGEEDSPSSIDNLRIESQGRVETESIRSIGGLLEIASGSLGLHLERTNVDSSSAVRQLHVEGGELALLSEVRILDEVNLSGGKLDLGGYDLIMSSGTSFIAADPAVITSGREGVIEFTGTGQIQTNATSIPKLRVALSPSSTLSLTGDLRISEALMIDSGLLDLSTHTLTLDAGRWTLLGGQIGGAGSVLITGPVKAELATDYLLPKLIIRTSNDQNAFSLRSLTDSSHRLIVTDHLSIESGGMDLGSLDVVVGRPNATSTLSYEGGTISMLSGDSISDTTNGEIELSNTVVDLLEPLSLPNVRISGSSRFRSDSAPLRIERQITLLSGMLENTDSSQVRLADGVRVVRRGDGSFRTRPTFENSVDLFYEIRGLPLDGNVLETGAEIPAAGGIRSFIVDAGQNDLRLTESVVINDTLRLESGTLDLNGFALSVEVGATVHYDHSSPIAPAFAGGEFQPSGHVRLVYSGTEDITSTDRTFPSNVDVSELLVATGSSDDEAEGAFFILHANRRIDKLVVIGRNAASGVNLNGRSLVVDSDVFVESGVITSATEAILEVGDSLVIASDAAIRNVVGVLARGHSIINGLFDGYSLRAYGDVTVTGALGRLNGEPSVDANLIVLGLPNLEFSGQNQVLRMDGADEDPESVDDAVNRFIMTSSGVVRLESPGTTPFTLGVNNLVLRSGVVETGRNDLRLPDDGSGFDRADDAGSHVLGRVSRHLRPEQLGTNGERMRFEFPLGTSAPRPLYRPAFISFSEDDPLEVSTVISVGHSGGTPGGLLGLPLDAGEGVAIADAASFHWTLSARPVLPSSQTYSFGVLGTGLDAFSAVRNLRLIRRSDGAPWENAWSDVGSARQHDNAIVSIDGESVPFVQVVQASGGIPSEPEIVAIGIEASEMGFARVQVAHLMGKNAPVVDVVIDDSTAAAQLAFGEASPYIRMEPGLRKVQLEAPGGAEIVGDSLEFEAGRDYLVVSVVDERNAEQRLISQEARAIPTLEAKEDVSLAFFHGIPDAPPLSLRTRDDRQTLFTGIPFAELSNEYAVLAAENTGFDVMASSTSETLFSIRLELGGHAGEVVHALAGGYLDPSAYGASEGSALYLFTNHGRPLHGGVQVATEEAAEKPATFALHGNYPNPFNPSTSVVFDLPEAADVRVEVFDLLGRLVMQSGSDALAAGRRTLRIDASELPSGVYVYRVVARGTSTHRGSGKMTLVR